MKTGFSSLVCPGWDLETILRNGSELGFDGIELRGLQGELQLPLVPELASNPENVRAKFRESGLELVCLGTSASLDAQGRRGAARQRENIGQFIDLAAKLACPFVRVFAGEVQRLDNRRLALARMARSLAALGPMASRAGVTVLVENGGDFPGSDDLWFLMDAVIHPSIKVCWNQCHAMTVRERPTTSIPRLGSRIGLVHMCDGTFADDGTLLEYKTLGEGDIGVQRQIELLRGMTYDGYLIFEWPKMWVNSLPSPEIVLPSVHQYLKDCLDAEHPTLSAYKADKNKPKFAARAVAEAQTE